MILFLKNNLSVYAITLTCPLSPRHALSCLIVAYFQSRVPLIWPGPKMGTLSPMSVPSSPASRRRTFESGSSESRVATTQPAEPPPTKRQKESRLAISWHEVSLGLTADMHRQQYFECKTTLIPLQTLYDRGSVPIQSRQIQTGADPN
jgi:hypothetical protein